MKMSQLVENIKHNWTIKVLCFVIAFIIYLFFNISTLDTKVFSIPLQIKQEGEVVIVNMPTHFVRVSVKGKPEDIVQISEQDFSAVLDLNHYVKAGTFSVPVFLYISKQAALFSPLEYSCKPERLSLEVDKKISAYIPLEATFTGTVPQGYSFEASRIEPSFVEVVGPEKIVSEIKTLKTKEVSLDTGTASFVKSVDIINTNNFVHFDKNTKASVSVDIEKIFDTKSFNTNLGSFMGLSDNLYVEEDFPQYSLVVYGFINDIENFYIDANTVTIDFSEIEKEGRYQLPLKLEIPQSFEILSFEPQKIELNLKQRKPSLDFEE